MEFTSGTQTVVFPPNSAEQTVLVNINDDSVPESDEEFFLFLFTTQQQFPGIVDTSGNTARGIIIDDDLSTFLVLEFKGHK